MIDVAVFAYNEERCIGRAVNALLSDDQVRRVAVLANGCSDSTMDVVKGQFGSNSKVDLVELSLGDKCNAWNHYVHDLARDDASMHAFTDGDCYCSQNALSNMNRRLLEEPNSAAAAATPFSGRNRKTYIDLQRKYGWVYGNLYGISLAHFQAIRSNGLRLPIGLKGNDHFITKLLQAPIPRMDVRAVEQVAICENAGYHFDRLNPLIGRDIKTYWNRRVTYFLRQRQIPLLNPLSLDQLPATVDEVNREILADLRRKSVLSPVALATRRKLESMYPSEDSMYYRDRFGIGDDSRVTHGSEQLG